MCDGQSIRIVIFFVGRRACMEYNISKHAMERYAERIMDRDHKVDVNRYVLENESKIKEDINKMIEFGQIIYCGKQTKENKKQTIISVFVKDCWIVLVDVNSGVVITLYKVDLGLDDEFNKLYVNKMLDSLERANEVLHTTESEVKEEANTYNALIADNESMINDYKSNIKALEELNTAYSEVIDKSRVKLSIAEEKVIEIVNKLIGKKEF